MGLVDGVLAPIFKERKLAEGQQLAWGDQRRIFPPQAPGFDGYDNDADNAVVTKFASGCAAVISFATTENRRGGRSCFLGMFDPSARPLVPKNELTFAVPMSRFEEMLKTMADSVLYQKAFSVVKRRINGEIG